MPNSNLTKTQPAKPLPTLQELAQNLRSDCYYFAISNHIGDTYWLLRGKSSQSSKEIYAIKPSHEFVFELFGDKNYIVCEEKGFEIFSSPKCFKLPNVARLATLGKLVPTDWVAFVENKKIITDGVIDCSPTNGRLPTNLPKLDENLKAKIQAIAPLDKIVLFAPEAQSMGSLPLVVFVSECKKLREKGYFIIVNLTKEREKYRKYFVDGVYDLDLSLKDAVALALACAGVLATRSGFCDIIAANCANLKVYFTDDKKAKLWSLSAANPQAPAVEINVNDILEYKMIKQDLQNSLPLKLYQRYIAKGFLRRVRTPFTAYFKIYKNHKRAMANGGALGISGSELDNSMLDCSMLDKEMLDYLTQTYEYQLGLLLEKACKGFWRGGFVWFVFDYLKLRKRKKTLIRLGEILTEIE